MMSRSFTKREKSMLLVLVILLVAAAYYFLVLNPSMQSVEEAKLKRESIETLLQGEEDKAKVIADMKTELAKVEDGTIPKVEFPDYDNFRRVLEVLNKALVPANDYQVNFRDVEFDGGLALREIQIVFYTDNYSSARSIVEELYSGPYRCDITSLKMDPTNSGSNNLNAAPVTTSLNITYYEIYRGGSAEADSDAQASPDAE